MTRRPSPAWPRSRPAEAPVCEALSSPIISLMTFISSWRSADVGDQRLVLGPHRVPIGAVQLGIVEAIFHAPPGVVEHLVPFLRLVDPDGDVEGDPLLRAAAAHRAASAAGSSGRTRRRHAAAAAQCRHHRRHPPPPPPPPPTGVL